MASVVRVQSLPLPQVPNDRTQPETPSPSFSLTTSPTSSVSPATPLGGPDLPNNKTRGVNHFPAFGLLADSKPAHIPSKQRCSPLQMFPRVGDMGLRCDIYHPTCSITCIICVHSVQASQQIHAWDSRIRVGNEKTVYYIHESKEPRSPSGVNR